MSQLWDVQVEETTVGNRRSVPRLGIISLNVFWYAFLLCGHSLPSVNSRTIVMCLYLGVGSSRGERDRTHWWISRLGPSTICTATPFLLFCFSASCPLVDVLWWYWFYSSCTHNSLILTY